MTKDSAHSVLSARFNSKAGSAIQLSERQQELTSIVCRKMQDGAYRMIHNFCPCGNLNCIDIPLSQIDRYGLKLNTVLCSACGTLRINPYLDETSLSHFYTNYYQEMYARSNDHAAYFDKQKIYGRRILKFVRDHLPETTSVFEVGCGAGGALHVLSQFGYKVSGCDYSHALVNYGCSRALSLHWGAPGDVLKTLPAPSLIFMNHVFEHVNDPLVQLQVLGGLLSPGGKLLIIVPDVSRISEFSFPAGDLRLFLHIAHPFNFSLEGFCLLAARAGFDVEYLQQRDAHHAPEFWALLTKNKGPLATVDSEDAGNKMLSYLRRTERLHRIFLTRGQCTNLCIRAYNKLLKVIFRARRIFFST